MAPFSHSLTDSTLPVCSLDGAGGLCSTAAPSLPHYIKHAEFKTIMLKCYPKQTIAWRFKSESNGNCFTWTNMLQSSPRSFFKRSFYLINANIFRSTAQYPLKTVMIQNHHTMETYHLDTVCSCAINPPKHKVSFHHNAIHVTESVDNSVAKVFSTGLALWQHPKSLSYTHSDAHILFELDSR